jgi:uncharacterized Zn finger protein
MCYIALGDSKERHGTLYRCKDCGTFFEVILEERSIQFTPIEVLRRYYNYAFPNES